MKKNNLGLTHLLEIENRSGNLAFSDRLLSWLKAGKSRMLPFSDWIKCGFILLCGFLIRREKAVRDTGSWHY